MNFIAKTVLVFVVILIFGYSITSAFSDNPCGYQDSFFSYLVCNAIVLAFALAAPIWMVMWPIVLLMIGLAMPFAGLNFIYGVIFRNKDDKLWEFTLGCILLTASYFYMTKVAIPLTIGEFLPSLLKFFQTIIEYIN